MYRRFGRARLPGGPAAKPSRVPALPRGTVLCRYAGAIDAQIAAFLNSGGEIQQIAKGVSGQIYGASKQITIGKK